MQRFLSFLAERVVGSLINKPRPTYATSGADAERQTSRAGGIKQVIGKPDSHVAAKDIEHIKAGSSVTVHAHRVNDAGKHEARFSSGKNGKISGWHPISKVHKPGANTNEQAENHQREQLAKHIEQHKQETGKPMPFRAPDGTIHHVTEIRKSTPGAKSDFTLHNDKGEVVYHGSLKKGSEAKHFNGYGGISKVTNSIKHVVNKVSSHLKNKPLGSGEAVFHKLDASNPAHEKAVSQTVFGHEHGSEQHSEHNIHGVHHGNVRFVPHPQGGFHIASDLDIHNNGGSTIKKLEKAHKSSIGLVVRKGEEGKRIIPGTNQPGRATITAQTYRPQNKVRDITND